MNKMKFIRESLGISQYQLGFETGIKPNRISMIERGWIKPTPEEIEKIAEYLEMNPAGLLKKIEFELVKS